MVSVSPILTFLTVDQPQNYLESMKEVTGGVSIENRESNLLNCTVCFEEFSSLIKLQRHYVRHVIYKPFQCNKCEKSFFTEAALQMHINLHIKKSTSTTTCPICSNRFKNLTEYQKHLSIHDFPKLVCNVCFKHFHKSFLLQKHEKCHISVPEGSKCYICVICKVKFMSKHELEGHLNKHEKVREFTCKECDATFFFSYLLRNHKQIHNAKEYCNICSQSFQNKKLLNTHEKTHLKKQLNAQNVLCFTCELCNAIFPFKSDLEAHFNNDHDGSQRYPCTVCDKIFFFSYLCWQHKFSHMETRKFQCSQCLRKLGSEKLLNRHMIEIHSGQKKHVCPQCGKQFSKKWTMQQHFIAHTNQKKYDCTFCKSTFTRKENLERHYQIHMNKKIFKCDKCDSEFSRITKLRHHQKLHEKDEALNLSCYQCKKKFVSKHKLNQHTKREHPDMKRVYICETCGKVYQTQSALAVHCRMHSGEKPYKCKICDERFILKKHLYSHHKHNHPFLDLVIDLPFKCTYCNEAYILKRSLLIHHKKIHSFLDLQI